MMPYRLYYWIKGVPENRPGGPWWCRDFFSSGERQAYFNDIVEFLHAYCWELNGTYKPKHGYWNIKPSDMEMVIYG